MTRKNIPAGSNDPRFARGSGFFETIGIGAAIGGAIGYLTGWEGIALYEIDRFLPPHALFSNIHQLGILPHPYLLPLASGLMLGGLLGAAAGYRLGHIPHEIHVRGRKLLWHEPRKIARLLKPKGKSEGIYLHPQIQISEHQECRHFLILGAPGSGKTSILWPVINQSVGRGDKALIFSFKGDFQEKAEFPFTLLAPWDARSARWQLGKDIRTRLHAESLAATLIPLPEKDAGWAQGAQALCVAVISKVQREKGVCWGFPELAQALSLALSDYDSLVETVIQESPIARSFLMGKESRTTASYLSQLANNLTPVINLGVADYQKKTKPWSVSDWLAGKTPGAVILGYYPESPQLSKSFLSSVIEETVKQILAFPDCQPSERRVWLFLDEVPQAGKIPSITQALEAARSKGCRVVLGLQSLSQLEENGYSKNVIDIWSGTTGTQILARLSTPKDQRWASDLLGERELDRYAGTTNVNNSGQGGNSGQSGGYQRVREHLMMPAEFGSECNVDIGKRGGPSAVLITEQAAGLVKWPFPMLQAVRKMITPAAWTQPGFMRPLWGKTPPPVAQIPHTVDPRKQEKKQGQNEVNDDLKRQQQEHAGQDQKPEVEGAGDFLADAASDHVAGAMLDIAVAPGAGQAFEAAKMLAEIFKDAGGGSGPVSTHAPRQVQQQQENRDRDQQEPEQEEEDEG